MYELWVIKWLFSKACKTEFDHLLQQRYAQPITRDKTSNYKVSQNKEP